MEKPRIKFVSSWDDGGIMDVRLAALLKEYGLPGIFFIPSNHAISQHNLEIIAKDFEIGGHTVSHFQDMKFLDDKTLMREIKDNKIYLEHFIAGKEITKFCYPRGRYDDRVIEAVKRCGFTSARTTIVLKTGFEDPFKQPTAIHVFQRNEYDGEPWEKKAKFMAGVASSHDGLFHIWGHSKEIERDSNWGKLEAFFKWLVKNYQIEV